MKRVKPLSTVKCYCCAVRAAWKSQFLVNTQFACENHKQVLEAKDLAAISDDHMSEGDYQSWGRL